MIFTFEKNYDTAIVGGGLAGAAAAIASARNGAKTVLIEQSGILGGQATLGIVTPLSATRSVSNEPFGGICEEIVAEAMALSRQFSFPRQFSSYCINPHITKYLLLKKCLDAGVEVMFHTTLTDAEVQGDRISSLTAYTKSGFGKIKAKSFVDASGDGDLVYVSNAGFYIGSEAAEYEELAKEEIAYVHFDTDKKVMAAAEKSLQPVSIFFKMRDVDVEKAMSYNNKRLTYSDLCIDADQFKKEEFYNTCGFEENGELIPLPQGRILVTKGIAKDEAVINMSRVIGIDGSDAQSLNKGECLAQLQVIYLVDFLKKYVDGFQNAYLTESGSTLGIRETRRMKGQYLLKGKDAIQCKRFEDAVARGSYIIDIHDPMGKNKAIGGEIKGDFYDIPLRSLISEKYENLFAAGRCISADHVAHSTTRIQGTCLLTGQAAGTAAALYGREGKNDAQKVRSQLMADGVNL